MASGLDFSKIFLPEKTSASSSIGVEEESIPKNEANSWLKRINSGSTALLGRMNCPKASPKSA